MQNSSFLVVILVLSVQVFGGAGCTPPSAKQSDAPKDRNALSSSTAGSGGLATGQLPIPVVEGGKLLFDKRNGDGIGEMVLEYHDISPESLASQQSKKLSEAGLTANVTPFETSVVANGRTVKIRTVPNSKINGASVIFVVE